jgi:hypothetical protein
LPKIREWFPAREAQPAQAQTSAAVAITAE